MENKNNMACQKIQKNYLTKLNSFLTKQNKKPRHKKYHSQSNKEHL